MLRNLVVLVSIAANIALSNGQAVLAPLNDANQQAAKLIEQELNNFWSAQVGRTRTFNVSSPAWSSVFRPHCRTSAEQLYTVSEFVKPEIVCNAMPGADFACTVRGAAVKIDGHWCIETRARDNRGVWRLNTERGRYTLTVRDYDANWPGYFPRWTSSTGTGRVSYAADMLCNNRTFWPLERETHYGFGLTRISGTESPEVLPLVEKFARMVADDYFCWQSDWGQEPKMRDIVATAPFRFQMTWQERIMNRFCVPAIQSIVMSANRIC